MRIDLNSRAAETVDATRETNSRSAGARSHEKTASGDSAEVTLGHRRLVAQANQAPEIRKERVAALAKAVADGTYQVSPEQTAEAIMSEMIGRSARFR